MADVVQNMANGWFDMNGVQLNVKKTKKCLVLACNVVPYLPPPVHSVWVVLLMMYTASTHRK
jgi:hypothetical protein